MMERCYNPKHRGYLYYGGRGITVCQRWHDVLNFVMDMNPRPPGTTLDRINNEGNYDPFNCRWASRIEQTRNRRCTIRITIGSITQTIPEWAAMLGLPYKKFSSLSREQAERKILRHLK